MRWLIDKRVQERGYQTGFPSLAEAARSAGHVVHEIDYVPFSHVEDIVPAEVYQKPLPTVVHGCIPFCQKFEKTPTSIPNLTPGLYFNKNVKSFAIFAAHYGDLMMNSDFYVVPWAEVKRRRLNGVFVKPLSGLKSFVGQVIIGHDYNFSITEVDDEELCVVSTAKEIQAEFRYVIAEGKVVTGSEYRWDDVLDVRTDTHLLCDEVADMVAKHPWQPDSVYVCDVALLKTGGAKVIELNAFSSSGLYACDTNKIVEAVSTAATREYQGWDDE